jgi:tRNA (cmo5U34)-methyltransferase
VAGADSMSSRHSVQTHLGMAATEYDHAIRRFIPGYEKMLSTIASWLSQVVPEDGFIIELGGGTGSLTEAVLTRLPQVRIELWDVDRNMLVVAEERLRRFGDRAGLRERSFTEPLDACNGVMATLSLHHIRTLDEKRAVYAHILEALADGGIFLSGDCTLDSAEPAHSVMVRYWLDFMATQGITEAEGRKHLADWAAEDTYQQMSDELRILTEAGFRRPEVFWREGPFAVYGGVKA